MDIQGYILDKWMAKMSEMTPVLTIYDPDGQYKELLPIAEQKGIKVIDTTKSILETRQEANRYWMETLGSNPEARMIVYRQMVMPSSNREWVNERYAGFICSSAIFPFGPADEYKNICKQFLPTKTNEIEQLFQTGNTSFGIVNALQEGQAFPALEALTDGHSFMEITMGLLALEQCPNMNWVTEWTLFANIHYPGLSSNGATLRDIQGKLWSYLLFSEFVLDLPTALPDSLQSVPHAPESMKEGIYTICDKLRANHNMRDAYVIWAKRVGEQLHLPDLFSRARNLGERVTFNFENKVEYKRFIEQVKQDTGEETATALLRKNMNDVWYQEDDTVRMFWDLAQQLLNLTVCINNGIKTDGSLADLINWYVTTGYKADQAFRKFQTQKLNGTIPMEDDLSSIFYSRYREFTERSVRAYQEKVSEIVGLASMKNQVCPQTVIPELQQNRRVVVLFVDALRYEMGTELSDLLQRTYPDHQVECTPKISILPSVTRFGMANHLGAITMKPVNGLLQPFIGEKMVSDVSDRIAYLREVTGVEVQDTQIDSFDVATINAATQLLIVRSTSIDAVGEARKSVAPTTMAAEMRLIVKCVEKCRQLGFDELYMVADHGFMLQPSFRMGDKIDKPVGSDICLEESRCLVGNLNESADTISFTPSELGINGHFMKIAFAKNYTSFRKGEIYYHEGLSLQENIVPIVKVTLKEEQRVGTFEVKLDYKGAQNGTVHTLAPLIGITVAFSDLFGSDVNLKLSITDGSGNSIGEPAASAFYDDMTELVHVPAGTTQFRQKIMINDDYDGSEIKIVAMDAESGATLATLRLDFDSMW